jgi:hypothetical protein
MSRKGSRTAHSRRPQLALEPSSNIVIKAINATIGSVHDARRHLTKASLIS